MADDVLNFSTDRHQESHISPDWSIIRVHNPSDIKTSHVNAVTIVDYSYHHNYNWKWCRNSRLCSEGIMAGTIPDSDDQMLLSEDHLRDISKRLKSIIPDRDGNKPSDDDIK